MARVRQSSTRRGLTVLEVLFAMGIAIVGLLGIASLLPLAGRNAADSVRVAEAQALAHSWYDDFVTRGLGDKNSLVYYHDFNITNGLNKGWIAATALPTQKLPTQTTQRSPMKQAICIDPYFLTSRQVSVSAFTPGSSGCQWYRPSVFPYYLDNLNPSVDPANPFDSTVAEAQDQPRMVRLTFGNATANTRMSAAAIREIFASADDLAINAEATDTTLSAVRVPVAMAKDTNSNEILGRMTSTNHYTWLATICPVDTLLHTDDVGTALLSIAVIHKRDIIFFSPSSPPTRPSSGPDLEGKPQGERYFRVVPDFDASSPQVPRSFVGGHGGTVTLLASDGVKNDIRSGDWLLLGKNRTVTNPVTGVATTTPPTVIPIFRWYRVISVEDEPFVGTVAQYYQQHVLPPNTNYSGNDATQPIWAKKVVLEGPDWVFDTATTATYVPGTVAVYERAIAFE